MNLSDKKKHYKAEIEKIASSVYNGEQKQLACYILDNANADNIDSIYTFITQRVKLGFTFDAAPEVNHNCISLVRHNPKLTFGNIGGEHKLIIGENYDALKNLLVTYTKDGKGLIDVIYIDPPYNTEAAKGEGNNYKDDVEAKKFIYRDKFTRNGWLNMMRERLVMARKLLSDRGIIFVSIDDTEQAYLKVLMDEIFGENNFISNSMVLDNLKGKANDNFITSIGSYLLIYARNKNSILEEGFRESENVFGTKIEEKFTREDEFGPYGLITFKKTGQAKFREDRPYMFYPILQKDGLLYSITKEEYEKIYNNETKTFNDFYLEQLKKKYNDFEFLLPYDKDGKYLRWTSGFDAFNKKKNVSIVYEDGVKQKDRPGANEMLQVYVSGTPKNLMYKPQYAMGTDDLQKCIPNAKFDFPKPVQLIKDIIELIYSKNVTVMDFFAGSGTTGQAVMELNAADGGNRKCILVTNNENNIATDITYERLYRLVNGKGTKGEKFPWTYKPEQPYLTNNRWEVFELEQAELKIDDFDKAKELLAIAEKEFKLLNPNYDMKGLDIYNQLASLNPYKATDIDKKNDKCN